MSSLRQAMRLSLLEASSQPSTPTGGDTTTKPKTIKKDDSESRSTRVRQRQDSREEITNNSSSKTPSPPPHSTSTTTSSTTSIPTPTSKYPVSIGCLLKVPFLDSSSTKESVAPPSVVVSGFSTLRVGVGPGSRRKAGLKDKKKKGKTFP